MNNLDYLFPLFAPASRPKLISKAWESGATCIIIDLEDAVAPDDKDMARENVKLAMQTKSDVPTYLRINTCGTKWHELDVELLSTFDFHGVMLPKTETVEDLKAVRRAINYNQKIIGLIETAKGMVCVNELARHCDRLAFGSIDYCADLDIAHTEQTLLFARSSIVLASRVAEISAPIDGVTTSTKDENLIKSEAAHSQELGFKGKLLIHPSQIAPTYKAFEPSLDDVAWAERIIKAGSKKGAIAVDGAMVDAPVIMRAENILAKRDFFT